MPSYLAVNLNGSLRQTGGQASTTTMLGSSAVSASSYANQAPVMSVYGDPARSGARRRVGPPVVGGGGTNSGEDVSGSWLNWLDKHYNSSTNFNNESALAAYNDMIANWNPKMGPAPSYSDWLAWLQNGGSAGYEINGHTYKFPIGDIVPLILMALSYLVMMFVRKR
jgi:hypothetical protein